MTVTTDALARHVAGTILADWLRHHTRLEPWELARALGREADCYGRIDLDCGPDSPAVAATRAAVEALAAELVRYCRTAPPGQDRADERLLARLTVSGERLRQAGVWFPEIDAWFVAHLEHRRTQPTPPDDPARLLALAARLRGSDPGE